MKSKSCVFLLLFIFLLSISFLFIFRVKTTSSPWKNWQVVSVNKTISETDILSEFEKNGITTYISLSSKRLSINSKFCPVLPEDYSDYSKKIDKYFFDKSNTYQLYYIPKSITHNQLAKIKYDIIVNNKSNMPLINLILCFLLLVVIAFLLKDIRTSLCFSPFLLFCYSFPSFVAILSTTFACIAISLYFLLSKRKKCFISLLQNPLFLLCFVCSLIFPSITKITYVFFILFTYSSVISLYHLSKIFEEYIEYKLCSFKFSLIVTANSITVVNKKNQLKIFIYSISFLVIGLLSFFLPKLWNNNSKQEAYLSIPAPIEYTRGGFTVNNYLKQIDKHNEYELPNLANYISQIWNSTVYPFISLSENPGFMNKIQPNHTVKTFEYVEVDNKKVEQQKDLFTFNDKFVDSAMKKITEKKNYVIENILFDEKHFCSVEYTRKITVNNDNYTVLIIISLVLLTVINLFFCLNNKDLINKRGFNDFCSRFVKSRKQTI